MRIAGRWRVRARKTLIGSPFGKGRKTKKKNRSPGPSRDLGRIRSHRRKTRNNIINEPANIIPRVYNIYCTRNVTLIISPRIGNNSPGANNPFAREHSTHAHAVRMIVMYGPRCGFSLANYSAAAGSVLFLGDRATATFTRSGRVRRSRSNNNKPPRPTNARGERSVYDSIYRLYIFAARISRRGYARYYDDDDDRGERVAIRWID